MTAEADTPEILLVMPVFNEAASIQKVVLEWFSQIAFCSKRFVILAIDDGSTDDSLQLLRGLQQQLGIGLEVVSRENRGHGQSCLEGYRIACARGIPWVFQIDSDGQCDPRYFPLFWKERQECDVIYGHRVRRDDGWRRIIAGLVLKWTLRLFAGVWCVDANVPYRLMRTEQLPQYLEVIPKEFSLANVALSVLLKRDTAWRHRRVPIRFRERCGGEPSVRLSRFGQKAFELVGQLPSLPRP